MGPRVGLDTGEEKNHLTQPEIHSRPSSPYPVALQASYSYVPGGHWSFTIFGIFICSRFERCENESFKNKLNGLALRQEIM
jgi:hypothetical protein